MGSCSTNRANFRTSWSHTALSRTGAWTVEKKLYVLLKVAYQCYHRDLLGSLRQTVIRATTLLKRIPLLLTIPSPFGRDSPALSTSSSSSMVALDSGFANRWTTATKPFMGPLATSKWCRRYASWHSISASLSRNSSISPGSRSSSSSSRHRFNVHRYLTKRTVRSKFTLPTQCTLSCATIGTTVPIESFARASRRRL